MPDNPPQSSKLLEQVRIRLRAKHYAYRTEKHRKFLWSNCYEPTEALQTFVEWQAKQDHQTY